MRGELAQHGPPAPFEGGGKCCGAAKMLRCGAESAAKGAEARLCNMPFV